MFHVRKIAAIVMSENDLDAINVLIQLKQKHGADIIDKAAKIVEAKQIANSKRSIGYLIGTIKVIGM